MQAGMISIIFFIQDKWSLIYNYIEWSYVEAMNASPSDCVNNNFIATKSVDFPNSASNIKKIDKPEPC